MEDQKLLNILDKLLIASRMFKIEWTMGKSTESYKCSIGNSQINILTVGDQYYLLIYNEKGNEIGRLAGYENKSSLRELYNLAKRKALKIDETLDNLDNMLKNLK